MSETSSDLSAAIDMIHTLNEETRSSEGSELRSPSDRSSDEDLGTMDGAQDPSDGTSSVQYNDVGWFCERFNNKVGVGTTSLSEVMEIIDILLENNGAMEEKQTESEKVMKVKTKYKTLKQAHEEAKDQMHKAIRKGDALQSSCDKLKYQNHKLVEELAATKQQLELSRQ